MGCLVGPRPIPPVSRGRGRVGLRREQENGHAVKGDEESVGPLQTGHDLGTILPLAALDAAALVRCRDIRNTAAWNEMTRVLGDMRIG